MSDSSQAQDLATMAKNQINFQVQNNTEYTLFAQSSFADWGDFMTGPSQIGPRASGNGGHIISSHSPFTGSAGMVGYKITIGEKSIYLRLLASNPYLSAKDNYATAAVLLQDSPIDQANYNWLYYEPIGHGHASKPWQDGNLKVTWDIGQADDATAIFTIELA